MSNLKLLVHGFWFIILKFSGSIYNPDPGGYLLLDQLVHVILYLVTVISYLF